MKIVKSPKVKHDLSPIKFAYGFIQTKAKRWGKSPLNGVTVHVTNTNCGGRNYCGRAFRTRDEVLIRVGQQLPAHLHVYPLFKGMPQFWLWGGAESIVYIAAHELGHLIRSGHGRVEEIACCKLGYEAVEAWRNRQYEHPDCLI